MELLLTIGDATTALVAGEVEEQVSGSLAFIYADESVLAFPDASAVESLPWRPRREALVETDLEGG